jgi:hypothetical protein
VDADDQVAAPNVLQVVMQIAQEHHYPDVLVCKEQHYTSTLMPKQQCTFTPAIRVLSTREEVVQAHLSRDRELFSNLSGHNKFFRRDFLQAKHFSCAHHAIHADTICHFVLALASTIVQMDGVYYQVLDRQLALGKLPYRRKDGCNQVLNLAEHTHQFYLKNKEEFAPIQGYMKGWTLLGMPYNRRFFESWSMLKGADQRDVVMRRYYTLLVDMLSHYPPVPNWPASFEPIVALATTGVPFNKQVARELQRYFGEVARFRAWVNMVRRTLPKPVFARAKKWVYGMQQR